MRVTYGICGVNEVDVTHQVVVDNRWFVDPGSDIARSVKFKVDPVHGKRKFLNVCGGGADPDEVFVCIHHPESSFAYKVGFASVAELVSRLDSISSAEAMLHSIHTKLISGGFAHSLSMEVPEQIMSCAFIRPDAQVLEIGANVGRNTCVIASILRDPSSQLITLECDPKSAQALKTNQARTGLKFCIVEKALSARVLEQRGWETREFTGQQGWQAVATITWDELVAVMNGKLPDTLVLDCEGAFLPIVRSFPFILNTVHTIIMENDYLTAEDYREVARILEERNLVKVFERALEEDSPLPCKTNFFEVWQIRK
jgi:FkbM family methyltransferase